MLVQGSTRYRGRCTVVVALSRWHSNRRVLVLTSQPSTGNDRHCKLIVDVHMCVIIMCMSSVIVLIFNARYLLHVWFSDEDHVTRDVICLNSGGDTTLVYRY